MKNRMLNFIPIILLVILMLYVFYPILTGGTYLMSGVLMNDQWLFNYPLKEFYRSQLINGKLPLWTSLIGNGYPLLAEGQVGALYPLNLIFFSIFSTITAYNINILLHFIMASIFTYLYSRNLGLSRKASFISAVTYSLSGFMTVHIHQININMVITYLPMALLAVDKIIIKKRVWVSVLVVVLTLQILAGHIEMFYYCLGIVLVYMVLRLFVFRPLGDGNLRESTPASYENAVKRSFTVIIFVLFSVVLSLTISFIQIAGTYELNKMSQRSEGLAIEHATATIWPLKTLGLFVNPRLYEVYRVEKEYTPTGITVNTQALYGYVGIIPLILALFALAVSRKKITVLFGILMLVSFVYGIGRSTQFFSILWNLIPGLKFFRFPTKILFLIEFCLAVLAGIGFDTVAKRFKIYDSPCKSLTYVLIGLSLADLMYFNAFGTRKIINAGQWLSQPGSAKLLSEKLGDPYTARIYVHGMSNIDYSWATNEEYQMVFKNMLPIDFNMIYKIPTNQEWAVLFLERQSRLNGENAKIDLDKGVITLTDRHKKALALQSVRYLVSDVEIIDPDLTETDTIPFPSPVDHIFYVNTNEGTVQAKFPVTGVHIYENKYFYPRVFFVSDYKIIENSEEVFNYIMEEGFDAEREAVLESHPGSEISLLRTLGNLSGNKGSVRITEDKQDRIEIDAEIKEAGFLVLADSYYPGWKAYVDGKETEILKTNYAFRGIYIGGGEHKVVMEYVATYWRTGKWVSLGGLGIYVILTVGLVVGERKKRVD